MKKNLFISSMIVLMVLVACNKDEEQKLKLKACFSFNENPDFNVGDTLKFSNCSENANSFIWDFGDGNISTEKSPWHVYQEIGNYSVKLSVVNKDSVDAIVKPIHIIDKYFTDLHDTLVQNIPGYIGETFYYLDIDKDGTYDVKIATRSFHNSHTLSLDYVNVTPLNSFKIAYSDTTSDAYSSCNNYVVPGTVMVPKVFKLGDAILVDNNFTQDSLMIYYHKEENNSLSNCPSYIVYNIKGASHYYLAFYKEIESNYSIAWLKILKNTSNSIIVSSCYYSKNQPLHTLQINQ